MNTNALSVANYFVSLANRDGVELKQYGLMKRVYITHGLCLAYLDRPALDPRFDRVEAWKNGPVIPSVYHTFKHNGNRPITQECIIMEYIGGGEGVERTPRLADDEIREVADAVWEAYKGKSDYEIIKLLHQAGTPWSMCYKTNENNEIPDLYTKAFYENVMKEAEARLLL
jgi:uncharacterized phage-associated protein